MEAYILCIIDDCPIHKTKINEGIRGIKGVKELDTYVKLRILDMTPSAKVSLFDYPISKVRKALGTGKLEIEGLELLPLKYWLTYFDNPHNWVLPATSNDYKAPNKYLLNYYGKSIDRLVPVIRKTEDTSNKLVLVKLGYFGTNKLQGIAYDIIGNRHTLEFDSNLEEVEGRLINAKFIEKNSGKAKADKSIILINGKQYKIVKPNGELFNVVDEPIYSPAVKTDVTSSESKGELFKSSESNKDELFNSWIGLDDFEAGMQSLGIDYTIDENLLSLNKINLKQYDTLNIPVGIKRLSVNCTQYPNNIKTIRIPNTVDVIQEESLYETKGIERLVYQPGRNNYIFKAYGLSILYHTGKIGSNAMDYLPKDVKHILGFFRFKTINPVLESDLSGLKDLKRMDLSFEQTMFNGDIILPESLITISQSFNYFGSMNTLVLPNSLEVIENSFMGGLYEHRQPSNSNIDLERANHIEDIQKKLPGYNHIGLKTLVIKEGSNLEKIECAFDICDIEVLDLRNAKNLTVINSSFNNCHKLRKVLLPASSEPMSIRLSFNNCPSLTEIIKDGFVNTLTDPLSNIDQSFSMTNIQEITLKSASGLQIRYSFEGVSKVTVESNQVKEKFYTTNNENVQILLSKSVKKFDFKAFESTSINNVDFSQCNIETINSYCFRLAKGNVLDLFRFANISSIPVDCFSGASIKTIILPKNISIIGERAFVGTSLSKLFIPPSVKYIGTKALSMLSFRNGPLTVYSVKGAECLKKIRRYGFSIKEFDTIEEAYEAILGKELATSDIGKLKAKLAFSNIDNPTVVEMCREPYLENVNLFMKYYRILNNQSFDVDNIKVPLDRSKLKGLYPLGKLKELIYSRLDTYESTMDFSENPMNSVNDNKLSNPFKVLCNYITAVSSPTQYLSSIKGLYNLIMNVMPVDCTETDRQRYLFEPLIYSVIYNDRISSISSIKLIGQRGFVEDTSLGLLVISIGGIVVYITSDKYSTLSAKPIDHLGDVIKLSCDGRFVDFKPDEYTVKCTVKDILMPGNTVNWSSQRSIFAIDGVNAPPRLTNELIKESEKHLLVISSDMADSIQTRYLISTIDGTLFKIRSATSKFWYSLPECGSSVIEEQYDSIKKAPKSFIKTLKTKVLGENATNLLLQVCERDNLRKYSLEQPGAYDKLEPCIEWRLSKRMQSLGVESISDLDYNLINILFNTSFFKTVTKQISEIGLPNSGNSYKLKDGSTVVCCINRSKRITKSTIVGFKQLYISYVLSPDEKPEGMVTCYTSKIHTHGIVSTLLRIYSENAEDIGYLDNRKYKYDDFYYIYNGDCELKSWRIKIGISKKTGNIYLTADISHDTVYILFRFKDTESAMRFAFEMDIITDSGSDNSSGIKVYQIRGLGKLANYVSNRHNEKENPGAVTISKFRDFILEGEPNGVEFSNEYIGLSGLIARQPKKLD